MGRKMRAVKLREFPNGEKDTRLALTVPQDLARLLHDQVGKKFTCELTEDGILFRPAKEESIARPAWVEGGE